MCTRDDRFCLVRLGEVPWDMLPAGRQLGGAPANFAYHAAALGGAGAVASCVGDDESGREILRRLDELGVDRAAVAVDGRHPTGTVTVALDEAGRPHYTIHEPVAWDFIPFGPAQQALAGRADAVCFGSLAQRSATSRGSIQKFLAAVRPGCLRVFDINLRQAFYDRAVIAAGLERADVAKLNDEELPTVARLLALEGDEPAMLEALVRRYALRLAVLTRGPAGSVMLTSNERSNLGGEPVKVVDTVGAGDAFTAAVAIGLLEGAPLAALHRRAARLAAYVCTQHGAMPQVPKEICDS